MPRLSDDDLAQMEAVPLHQDVTRLAAAYREALAALELLLREVGDSPCRLDHHGFCQEHFLGRPCAVAAARLTLRPVGLPAAAPEPGA